MNRKYYRPIVQNDVLKPVDALNLAGGKLWFNSIAVHEFGKAPVLAPASVLPEDVCDRLCRPRTPFAGLQFNKPLLMGVLNVTPDSFSDQGEHYSFEDATDRARAMIIAGADILDVGGESTRPGAEYVSVEDEIARVVPVINFLRSAGITVPVSVDTRKSEVAAKALSVGASIFNDVSAFTWDEKSAAVAATARAPICLMHAKGSPKTMQDAPQYDDVLLEVYDFLEERIAYAESAGIARSDIIIDPGIGFGKTLEHNLTLIRGLSIFHGLGCVLLLGVSRKSFIGTIAHEPDAGQRMPGSVAVGLEGLRQGIQVLRVHDVEATRQAAALWSATNC